MSMMILSIGKEVQADEIVMACAAVTIDYGHRIHENAIECWGESLEDARQLRDMVMLGMVRSTRLTQERLDEIGELIQPANAFITELAKVDRDQVLASLTALRSYCGERGQTVRASRLDDAMFVLEHLPTLLGAYRALAKALVQQEAP